MRHRLPFWDEAIGITPDRVPTVDLLHCISLGTAQDIAMLVTHEIVHLNAFGVPHGLADVMAERSFLRLQSELEN